MKNRKIEGYGTISTYDLNELNKQANDLIRQDIGWEPYKRIQITPIASALTLGTSILYTQTMVQYN